MDFQEPDEQNLSYPGWRVAFAAGGAVFFSFASLLIYTFGVFLKPVAAEFDWSRQAVSLAFGLAAISVAACSPFIGAILDRTAARRILIPCFIIFGTGFASLALLQPHLWQLYATFILLGVVGNGTAHLAYTRALSTWFRQRRGAAFAILMSGGALGAMILPPITQLLINRTGWRGTCVILGTSVLLLGLPLASRIKEHAQFRATEDNRAGASVREGLSSRPFWIIMVVLFAASLSQNGALAHLAPLLSDRGIGPSQAALAVSVLGGATLIGRLLTGWLLDRYFAPRVAFVLLSFATLGVYLLASAHSAPLGFFSAALIGLGMGGEADITPYLLSRYFGLRSFSTLYGLSWTAYAVAGALGPVIMGRAFDLSGSYEVLLSRLSFFTLATAALMLLLPSYQSVNRRFQLSNWSVVAAAAGSPD